MESDKFFKVAAMTLCGALGSVIIGFIFYGASIFVPTKMNFQFVATGIAGSLFLSLFEHNGKKEQFLGLIVVFFINVVVFTGRSISTLYLLRDALFAGSIFISIRLYFSFIKRYSWVKFYLRSFALVLIYGILNIVCVGILFLVNASGHFPPLDFLLFIARYGILIGLGIGLGTDFYYQNRKHLTTLLNAKTV